MLIQLATVKVRLGILPGDLTQDVLLTAFIDAVSARFDRECGRAFARTLGATEEFEADRTEVLPGCYPVEAVSKFELKETEADGWEEQTDVDCVVRSRCVISLQAGLGTAGQVGRVTYTGGYVLPGSVPGAGQTALPKDVEYAAGEQVSAWFLNKDKLGLIRHWPSSGTYLVLSQAPLLGSVAAVVRRYQRWGG